jgi:hypothetical protein
MFGRKKEELRMKRDNYLKGRKDVRNAHLLTMRLSVKDDEI